eukprot:CAMPEP_0182846770 /NCGR_PEP_ID=MMETSP0006_2-20121128/28081_1 /TAXON_ID=97485 /ORGANISM="Prymnesium parvum, Strain Texoma1" /LENGTH=102 /DNA_ID=CAMNT_0024977017 /DNA_START=755 /DNA_END=1063 /DNA_ORIENTATION=+
MRNNGLHPGELRAWITVTQILELKLRHHAARRRRVCGLRWSWDDSAKPMRAVLTHVPIAMPAQLHAASSDLLDGHLKMRRKLCRAEQLLSSRCMPAGGAVVA